MTKINKEQLAVNRKSGVPIYLQLKEQIKKLIESGQWEAGEKIPTEREFAEALNISRNTVSTAYKDLEADGILISTQGKGTFVTDSDAVLRQEGKKERLLRLIDVALEEAVELGFTIDEFLTITHTRAREKKELLSKVKLAMVECNKEQLDYFVREISLGAGTAILPILLQDLRKDKDAINKKLEDIDIVISTFFHLQEVKNLIDDKKKIVIGIALNPQLETIVRIARYPRGTKLGIFCLSENYVAKIKNVLKQAGINYLDYQTTISKDTTEIEKTIAQVEVVVVSPTRRKEVEQLIKPGMDIIEFAFEPDVGSVNIIKSVLLELKQK